MKKVSDITYIVLVIDNVNNQYIVKSSFNSIINTIDDLTKHTLAFGNKVYNVKYKDVLNKALQMTSEEADNIMNKLQFPTDFKIIKWTYTEFQEILHRCKCNCKPNCQHLISIYNCPCYNIPIIGVVHMKCYDKVIPKSIQGSPYKVIERFRKLNNV